jgi:hypothetical protein
MVFALLHADVCQRHQDRVIPHGEDEATGVPPVAQPSARRTAVARLWPLGRPSVGRRSKPHNMAQVLDERRKVREQLERYCGQDTEGMIWIVDALRGIAL